MRTAVTLDRDLERVLRKTAACTHRPFKKILNDTLRAGIDHYTGIGQAETFVLKARPMGLLDGHETAGCNQLTDDLEAEAFLETTRKLMERGR